MVPSDGHGLGFRCSFWLGVLEDPEGVLSAKGLLRLMDGVARFGRGSEGKLLDHWGFWSKITGRRLIQLINSCLNQRGRTTSKLA